MFHTGRTVNTISETIKKDRIALRNIALICPFWKKVGQIQFLRRWLKNIFCLFFYRWYCFLRERRIDRDRRRNRESFSLKNRRDD